LAITDMSGSTVWSKAKVTESKVRVNVGAYPAGTYLIRVSSANGSVIKKLLIVK
jgi:hypothetical protein